jgi:hypothetical protein
MNIITSVLFDATIRFADIVIAFLGMLCTLKMYSSNVRVYCAHFSKSYSYCEIGIRQRVRMQERGREQIYKSYPERIFKKSLTNFRRIFISFAYSENSVRK